MAATFYIVDDEEDVTKLLAIQVKKHFRDAELHLFTNPLESLKSIRNATILPDIILCDLRMPEMSGLKLRQTMRAENIDVPFVFITAVGGEDIVEDDNVMLSKPINMQKLRDQILRLLGRRGYK